MPANPASPRSDQRWQDKMTRHDASTVSTIDPARPETTSSGPVTTAEYSYSRNSSAGIKAAGNIQLYWAAVRFSQLIIGLGMLQLHICCVKYFSNWKVFVCWVRPILSAGPRSVCPVSGDRARVSSSSQCYNTLIKSFDQALTQQPTDTNISPLTATHNQLKLNISTNIIKYRNISRTCKL